MALPKLDPPCFKLPFTEPELSTDYQPFSALDSYVMRISQQPPSEIEETINKLVAAMSRPTTDNGFKEAIRNIEEARAYQESMVLQTVIHMKNFDFLEDVCKYNHSLNKDFLQKASISETYDYCNEKFNHFHPNRYIGGKESNSDMQLEDHLFFDDSNKIKQKHPASCWMDEELEDYTNKKDDFSETLGDEMDIALSPIEDCKSKKFVYYSSNKKLVFGFDKVENLIDDNVIEEANRDILKELDHNINFDHPCYQNSRF